LPRARQRLLPEWFIPALYHSWKREMEVLRWHSSAGRRCGLWIITDRIALHQITDVRGIVGAIWTCVQLFRHRRDELPHFARL